MEQLLLYDGLLVTGAEEKRGSLLIEGDKIKKIWNSVEESDMFITSHSDVEVVRLNGKAVFAGGVDPHVHFRDPGLTHKADIQTESYAAILGGVTSFVDMPNTKPQTTSLEALQDKLHSASGRSYANYGFNIGATNTNFDEVVGVAGDESYAALKVFMGSSTGNMLVDDSSVLERIFGECRKVVMVHCEDESTIKAGLAAASERYGDDIPFNQHPVIRSRMACMKSSMRALEMAMRLGTRLHLCHVSTAEEVEMVRAAKIHNPNITAETSVNYLWFCDEDYDRLGSLIKCNPAIKTSRDRQALVDGLASGVIDSIGTDHAPHLLEEKAHPYKQCPSGMPSIQQSLNVLLSVAGMYDIPLTRIASAFSERPAEIFSIKDRGRLAEGYYADIVVVDLDKDIIVSPEVLAYKCGWSPYDGEPLRGQITDVFVNGNRYVANGERQDLPPKGRPLVYE